MFTKNNLKTGMFGVMNNGFKFVVVDDKLVYQNGEWDKLSRLDDNLCMMLKKVSKVFDGIPSFNVLDYALDGANTHYTPIYDRKRDTKPRYNGKVVCIDATINQNLYTVGKIYQFKDGRLTGDNGKAYPEESTFSFAKIYTFEDWKNWSSSKWLEIVE